MVKKHRRKSVFVYHKPPPKCEYCKCFGHWSIDCRRRKRVGDGEADSQLEAPMIGEELQANIVGVENGYGTKKGSNVEDKVGEMGVGGKVSGIHIAGIDEEGEGEMDVVCEVNPLRINEG